MSSLVDYQASIGAVRSGVAQLSPLKQQVIRLRYWEHRSVIRSAARLGVSTMAVAGLESLALDDLRQFLEVS